MSTTVEAVPSTGPARPPADRGMGWAALRPLVLRLHFYAGVLVAPFLLVAAATGLLYAASWQVEEVVYAHELSVPVGRAEAPLSEQVAAARAARPDGKVSSVRTPEEPGRTTRVLMDVPGLAESTKLAVFVDPYTTQVRGALESYGSSGALPLRAWISQLHRHLHLGEPGRIYSELAASWLWVVALGGLVLWLSRRRRGARAAAMRQETGAVTGRRRSLGRHGLVGVWALAGLLFLSATGLTWSKYAGENVDELRAALGWSTPSLSASAGDHAAHASQSGHSGHAGHGAATAADPAVDGVARVARGAHLSGPLEVVWPAKPGDAYLVKEVDNTWPQRLDQVTVAPAAERVTGRLHFADHPLAAKLTRWGIDAHMGRLFGLANQIVLAALAAGLILLIGYGYLMWWQRRPTRGFGRPYRRGAWKGVHLGMLVPLAALTVAVGLFVPLLGISLAVFLLLDVLLGLRARLTRR
ncbi:PepSY domain-containing protein [Nonomuraea sp. SMC257]|uniref:PepSY domain-containing protein n=1 Tax=Nonomuraea montanisoli TaxID=2741721 RepID=A0A7Y6IET7_9ACTN|nr:PepSY domain-containing protein [Nonomuraea montanisoli]NUW36323.1 PepSY domain-containing protein [Nonomuraea montanisoli]